MKMLKSELKHEEILKLAQQARLMIVDGEISYLNDMATDKELLAFVRLIESRNMDLQAEANAGQPE